MDQMLPHNAILSKSSPDESSGNIGDDSTNQDFSIIKRLFETVRMIIRLIKLQHFCLLAKPDPNKCYVKSSSTLLLLLYSTSSLLLLPWNPFKAA